MPSSRRRSGHGFNLKHCMCAPLRLVSRLLDMYVTNMNKFADQMSYEATFGFPAYGGMISVPRNYDLRSNRNCSSLDDELADLVRAASEKNKRTAHQVARNVHSRSVAITRIDEDKVCDFKDCDVNLGSGLNFARSRSCAPPAQSSGPFGLRPRYAALIK